MKRRSSIGIVASLAISLCIAPVQAGQKGGKIDYEHITFWKGTELDPLFSGPLAGADLADFHAMQLLTNNENQAAYWLSERALAIARTKLKPNNKGLGKYLHNSAAFSDAIGFTDRASTLYQEALVRENGSMAATTLTNLADLNNRKADYAQAVQFAERAAEICKAGCKDSDGHPQLFEILLTLSESLLKLDRLEEAERALVSADQILPRDPNRLDGRWQQLGHFAELRLRQNRSAEAVSLYKEAHAATNFDQTDAQAASGLYETSGTVQLIDGLAESLATVGAIADAIATFRHSLKAADATITRGLKEAYPQAGEISLTRSIREFAPQLNLALSLDYYAGRDHPELTRVAVETILRRQGLNQIMLGSLLSNLRNLSAQSDQKILQELFDTRSALAAAIRRRNYSKGGYESEIRELDDSVRSLEASLVHKHPEALPTPPNDTIENILALIPPDSVVVNYVRYVPRFIGKTSHGALGKARYRAYVLHRSGIIVPFDLGESEIIDRAVERFRSTLTAPQRSTPRERASLAKDVGSLVWNPISTAVGKPGRVIVIPDASLTLLPFAALPDEKAMPLINSQTISYLSTLSDLKLPPRKSILPTGPGVIVAAPDFDAGGGEIRNEWARLPGTHQEALLVKRFFPEATLVEGRNATSRRISQVSSPAFLHIATHAFFSPIQDNSLNPFIDETLQPMLAAGIAFAGANRHPNSGSDGIMSAAELTQLDLRSTSLVFLSACDTGLGEIRASDGLYGIRRALALAGAKVQVLSLWKVDDEFTVAFVREFYSALLGGSSASVALRLAQIKTPSLSEEWRDPSYWGAFVVSGDL